MNTIDTIKKALAGLPVYQRISTWEIKQLCQQMPEGTKNRLVNEIERFLVDEGFDAKGDLFEAINRLTRETASLEDRLDGFDEEHISDDEMQEIVFLHATYINLIDNVWDTLFKE